MRRLLKYLFWGTVSLIGAGLIGAAAAAAYAYFVLVPQLPSVETLRDVRLQVPLRVVSNDGRLIAEFGEHRRIPLDYADIPEELITAFIAAEDERFFEHPGVDYRGIARAAWHLVREREVGPGGSTITMQVARNFFLTREQTFLRKANEILLALKIERQLDKEQILELYVNKIYLGHRAYGLGAASQVYYGRPVDELDLAQLAMIAGLPKAPSRFNPIADPERAKLRRAYVLGRMLTVGAIDRETFEEAVNAPVTARYHGPRPELRAPYVAEMARAAMIERFGEQEAYTGGYIVHTTVDARAQQAAERAVVQGLQAYDRRHGYRGPEGRLAGDEVARPEAWAEALRDRPALGGLEAAVVIGIDDDEGLAELYVRGGDTVTLPFEAMAWARPYTDNPDVRAPAPEGVGDVVAVGDIVRIDRSGESPALAQVPAVQGALVAVSPMDGAIKALVGGYDFTLSSFNRAVQARRQTGSAFKPFIFSAALENGHTPATLVNDAPVVFEDDALEDTWRPGNYTGRFYGPTRLREALVHSRNLVSIRLLRDVGVRQTVGFVQRFGFPDEELPRNLSLALGSNSASPLEVAAAYAVFANGGYRVPPYFIDRIEDDADVLYRSRPAVACEDCPEALGVTRILDEPELTAFGTLNRAERVLPEDNAYLIHSMLRDVIERGTGRGALRLGRDDIAGKTGTTDDQRDAWFAGYNRDLVAAAWVGFDDYQPLGTRETGAAVALPIWRTFMAEVLDGRPERSPDRPAGLVTVRIDPETGRTTDADNPDAVFETFRGDTVPPEEGRRGGEERASEHQLF